MRLARQHHSAGNLAWYIEPVLGDSVETKEVRTVQLSSILLTCMFLLFSAGAGCGDTSRFEANKIAPFADNPSASLKPVETRSPQVESWQFTGCSDMRETNHTLIFSGNALSALTEGDTLFVFTQDGLCAGKSDAFSGKNFAIAAWGDDSATEQRDGLTSNENFQLVLKSTRFPEPVIMTAIDAEGPLSYQPDGITVIKAMRPE